MLTTEADVRYITGFLTRFFESPSRAWYIIVPASGKPVAVIPSIGAALMSATLSSALYQSYFQVEMPPVQVKVMVMGRRSCRCSGSATSTRSFRAARCLEARK